MTDDRDILGEPRDPMAWGKKWVDERLDLVDQDEWFSVEQKQTVRKNVAHLVDLLGPFNVAQIIHCTGWSTLFPAISWHVEALDAIGRSRGGAEFIARVKQGGVQDAASILELAWRFIAVGTEVEVEPTVEIGGVPKRPDLALLNSCGEWVCLIEATANANSTDQSTTDGFQRRIQPILFRNGFMRTISGVFTRVLTDEEILFLEKNLERAVGLLTMSSDQLIVQEGAYRLAISDDAEHDKACSKYGISPRRIAYPPFDPREEIRTLRKLKKEMLHFPSDVPALIVIEAHPIMVLIDDKRQRLATLRDAVREWMLEQKSLVAVVITVRFLAPQEPRIFESEGDFLIENSLGLTGLDHVLLFNPAFAGREADTLRRVVRKAFSKDYSSLKRPYKPGAS